MSNIEYGLLEPIWIWICGREVPGELPRCSCRRTEEQSIEEKKNKELLDE